MNNLKLLFVAVIVSEMCFAVDGKRKYKQKRQTLKKVDNPQMLDEEHLQVAINFCKAKQSSYGSRLRHGSTKTKRCIRRSLKELELHCSGTSEQSRKSCRKRIETLMQKTKYRSSLKPKPRKVLRSGRNKAICMSANHTFISYDPTIRICCGGQILLQPQVDCCHSNDSGSCCLGCCGGLVYDKTGHFCFKGHIQNISSKHHTYNKTTTTAATSTATHTSLKYWTDILHARQDGLGREVENEAADTRHEHITVVIVVSGAVTVILVFSMLLVVKNIGLKSVQTTWQCLKTVNCERVYADPTGKSVEESFQPSLTLSGPYVNIEENTYAAAEDTHDDMIQKRDSICSQVEITLDDLPLTIFKPSTRSAEELKAALNKSSIVPDCNILTNQYCSVQTQTAQTKQTNVCDSLGKLFQATFIATLNEGTIQLPHSDVLLTLPGTDLQDRPIECHVSSITDLEKMRNKLKLPNNQRFASPIAEYVLPNIQRLQEHAVIKLPVCGSSTNFRIIRVISDRGENKEFQEVYDIPILASKQEGVDIDTFCLLSENKRHVLIFTKVFSLYLKVESGETTDFKALGNTFIGMSHPKNDLAIVTVNTYILGDLSLFRDFMEPLRQKELESRRKQINDRELNFNRTVLSSDSLEVYLNIDDTDEWDFIRDHRRPELETNKQTVKVSDIILSTGGFSYRKVSWDIENKNPEIPSCFRCHIYIDHITNSDGDDHGTTPPIFTQHITETTKERRHRNSRSMTSSQYTTGSKHSSSIDSRSLTNSQYSTASENVFEKNPDEVRKELNNTMPSSYYDSQGKQTRPPGLPKPMPELDKGVVCSYDQHSVPNLVSQYNNL